MGRVFKEGFQIFYMWKALFITWLQWICKRCKALTERNHCVWSLCYGRNIH